MPAGSILSLGLSLQAHVNLTFYPFFAMWHVHLLYIVVGQAAHVAQFVDVVHEVAELIRYILCILMSELEFLLIGLANAVQRFLDRVEVHVSFAVLVLCELN